MPVLGSDKTACAATVYAAANRTRLVAFGDKNLEKSFINNNIGCH